MSVLVRRILAIGPLISRIIAALAGGYVLAALTSVAVLALPTNKIQAVIAGQLVSFLVYAGAVIWVFAVRRALKAWMGLVLVAVPLGLAAWSVP